MDRIVLTTNSQNKISSRDLHANDAVQADIERAFTDYGLFYERKIRQYDDRPEVSAGKILVNEYVAQSHVAIVLRRPSDARRRKYKVWSELYSEVFDNKSVEQYILPALMAQRVEAWLQQSRFRIATDQMQRKIANNAAFHVARIASFLWRNGDSWREDNQIQKNQIRDILDTPDVFDPSIQSAFGMLERIIRSNKEFQADTDGALKSSALDTELTKRLNLWRDQKAKSEAGADPTTTTRTVKIRTKPRPIARPTKW